VVWRIKVHDPATGNPMDNSTLDSVVVSLMDGQTFTATYGGHPGQPGVPVTDYFWSAAWSIPATYPTGSVGYTVTAKSKDGRAGTFSEFNVAPSLLTVVAAQPPLAQALILNADTVIGSAGATNPADICVQSSRFQQGESVVWRIKVYDPVTGNPMDNSTLDSVVVSLKDGQNFTAAYGGHPGQPGVPVTDYFWSTAWSIPKSYPTGSVQYTVTAMSKDGRTGTFTEFNVAPSLLTVVAAQ
jgi:predicted transcriptional regulator